MSRCVRHSAWWLSSKDETATDVWPANQEYRDGELVFYNDKTISLNKHGYGYGSLLIHTTKLTSNSAKYNPMDNLSSSQGPMDLIGPLNTSETMAPRNFSISSIVVWNYGSPIALRSKMEKMSKRADFWHIYQFWRNLIKVVRFDPSKFFSKISMRRIFGNFWQIMFLVVYDRLADRQSLHNDGGHHF